MWYIKNVMNLESGKILDTKAARAIPHFLFQVQMKSNSGGLLYSGER